MDMEELLTEAMKLGLEARAELAQRLILSVDTPTESEIEQLWLQEAQRRLREWQAGKVKAVPAEEVFQQAIAEIT